MTEFAIVTASKFAASIERAQSFEVNRTSEVWSIVVNSDAKGTPRPIFNFVVKGTWEADLVLGVAAIMNHPNCPNVIHCPFFCKGKAASERQFMEVADWFNQNADKEVVGFHLPMAGYESKK